MKQSELVEVVRESGAKILNESEFLKFETRTLEVKTLLCDVKFEWWINVIHVYVSGVLIICDDVESHSAWPNRYKMNLNLITDNRTISVIPTKE